MDPKTYFYNKTLCPAAWNNFYIDPAGSVRTCSIGKTELGNINTNTFDEILKSKESVKIRQAMIDGYLPDQCIDCINLEKNNKNAFSARMHYKKTITDTNNLSDYDKAEGEFTITGFDIRQTNTCQNACVYCSPLLSSKFASEMNKFPRITSEENLNSLSEFIINNLLNLKEIYFAGGEPLIIKSNLRILEELYKCNPSCKVRINSNIMDINNSIYTQSLKFKNLQYTISVDSMTDQYEYIRWPSKWQRFLTNLDRVMSDVPRYNFNMVLNILNWDSLLDTISLLLDKGISENAFIITHATMPRQLNINNLNNDQLDHFVQKTKAFLSNLDTELFLYHSLVGCVNFVDKRFPKDIDKTRSYLKQTDARRNLNSQALFPYIYN